MKILHVIPHLGRGSGAARIVKDLADYQVTHGNSVSIVSLSKTTPSYDKELKDLGCKVVYLEKKRDVLYHPKFFVKLRKIIKEYEIVHVHLFPALYWVALAKYFSQSSCKMVLTEHSTANNRQGKWWLKPVEQFMYNQYDIIVSITDAVTEYIHRYVDSRIKTITILNGIKLNCYNNAKAYSRADLGIPDSAFMLIQVSRFAPQKNQIAVMRTLIHLPKDFYAIFVGDGPELEAHKLKAKQMGLSDRIRFLGLRNDIPALLKTSDVVVLSTHFEGFGLAIVEGMAAGKPVVASNVDGLRDVIGDAGILFEPDDEAGLALYLQKLKEDQDYYNMIAERCRKRSLLFSSDVMGASYIQLYDQILRKK